MAYHPSKPIAYFSNEQHLGVSVYDVQKSGALKLRQVRDAVNKNEPKDGISSSDIAITPNGRFLFAGIRGHKRDFDWISRYRVKSNGEVELLGLTPADKIPWGLALSPDGHYLLATGFQAGTLMAFRIGDDGDLKKVAGLTWDKNISDLVTRAKTVASPKKKSKSSKKKTAPPKNNTAAGSSDKMTVVKDVEYHRAGGAPLLLDLYRPAKAKGRLPTVMWVHGGGWKNGSKNRCLATWLVEHGYAVASINYRLTDQAQWPAQIDDCRAAVRWLRTHADQHGLDGDHIGAWGSSAGGHLVAVLGTLAPPKNEQTSSRVQAVCDWYGPSDLLTMPPNVLSKGKTLEDIANSNGAKLLGGTVRDLPELAKQASAFHQVSRDDPPFLIMHGDKDPGVPIEQSQRLHAKVQAKGASSTLHVVKGAGHGGKAFQSPESRQVVLDF
ncbi:MAG: alpha/beta hydrolase fold domain-containing protein, partial [Planctomycetales bacterium]